MMNKLETALQYPADVRDGKIEVCRYVKLAVERHYRDLENAEEKGWYFSDKAAQKALRFFDFLVLTKAVSKATVPVSQINPDGTIRFQLLPWQAFMVASIYGWKIKATKKRRFTESYLEVPKKNAKSTLHSGLANLMLIYDNEPAPDIIFAAYTRDQANICFEEAVEQIKQSKELKSRVRILNNSVTIPKKRAKMISVSHDAKNTEGKNAHGAFIDEYHVHATDGVKDSVSTGQSGRPQPLLAATTTAGYNKQGPCYKHRGICIGALEGKFELDHLFALIYTIDEGDDWKDESIWYKANPSLGVTTFLPKLRTEFKMALQSGSKEVDFKTKRLNLWVDADVTWIPSEAWDKCALPNFSPPRGAICYGGIDLGQVSDMSCYALFFPEYNFLTVKHYVAAEAGKYASKAGIDYQDWIDDDYLTATPGRTTDYEYILNDIFTDADEYELCFIGIDPAGAQMFQDRLKDMLGTSWAAKKGDDGNLNWGNYSKVQSFRQGFISISPPTKLFEEMVINETLKHDGNPITGWMLGNVVLSHDAAGNIKPAKDKSQKKIDGIVAAVMAIGKFSEWHHHTTSNKGVPAC